MNGFTFFHQFQQILCCHLLNAGSSTQTSPPCACCAVSLAFLSQFVVCNVRSDRFDFFQRLP